MTVEDSEIKVREFIEARRMPKQVFQQLPKEDHGDALTYLGYIDDSAFYDFIAEKDGKVVRVDGLGVWERIAAKYKDSDGNISNNCCSGDFSNVKMEFHMFYSRLPHIALTR